MEPIYLQTEEALYSYLKKFLKQKAKAVQLDGATKPTPNNKVVLVFTYSINNQRYKLTGDLTRKAAETFVQLADEHGSPGVAFKEAIIQGQRTLILATTDSPKGWNCWLYTEKSSDKLKKVA